ncbi:MAG: hypothetical protein G01um101466_517 [Parcubacteria group bacterium Gr01-1014_66]|nr:MAG: hypothetical protein G01um101466_517 [Parcubacteria group bacterium Gr01-1014_66]
MLYLWDIKKLTEELIQNRVSEQAQMRSLLIIFLLNTFFIQITTFPSYQIEDSLTPRDERLLALELLILLGITIWGIHGAFRANQRGDGKHFLARFLSLYVPIGIRLIIGTISVLVLLFAINMSFFPQLNLDAYEDSILSGVDIVMEIIGYVWMQRLIEKIAKSALPPGNVQNNI